MWVGEKFCINDYGLMVDKNVSSSVPYSSLIYQWEDSIPVMSLSTNERQVFRSRDHSRPIRGWAVSRLRPGAAWAERRLAFPPPTLRTRNPPSQVCQRRGCQGHRDGGTQRRERGDTEVASLRESLSAWFWDHKSLSTNQRPVSRSRDHSQPIRGLDPISEIFRRPRKMEESDTGGKRGENLRASGKWNKENERTLSPWMQNLNKGKCFRKIKWFFLSFWLFNFKKGRNLRKWFTTLVL